MDNKSQVSTVLELDPERWLSEHGDFLYRYALRRVHDTMHAEDLVQVTLLAALEARANYSGRSSEKTWLVGILKHKIIDFIRKDVRNYTVDNLTALSDATVENGIDELFDARGEWICPPQDWGNPEKTLQNRQLIEFFELCMGKLKPILARVFALKELMGQPNSEICNELDITATNCGVMLYRARMALRRCLESHWSGTSL